MTTQGRDAWGTALSRRSVIGCAGAAALASLPVAHAQASTPGSTPAASPVALAPGFGQEFLFVQTAEAGSWQPKPGEEDVYLLTLSSAAAQTIYFSDRPGRVVGTVPMQQFLDGLGFTPDNPPNAAVVTGTGDEEDVLVIELLNPVYEAEADTLTYEARVLEGYQGEGLGNLVEQQTDVQLPATFGHTSLFIDDCNDIATCFKITLGLQPEPVASVPGGPIGTCWSWAHAQCRPCNGEPLSYYGDLCNSAHPEKCNGHCFVSVE